MSKESKALLEEFGLNDSTGTDETGITATEAETSPQAVETRSETALVLDEYCLAKGHDLVAGDDLLNAALPMRVSTADPSESLSEQIEQETDLFDSDEHREKAAADFYAAAFELRPELAEDCTDELRHEFMGELFQTPDYSSLHNATQLDACSSEMAASAFAQQYVKLLVKKIEHEKQCEQDGTDPSDRNEDEQFQHEMKNASAAAQACRDAQQDVDDLGDVRESLGIGNEAGGGGAMNSKNLAETFKKVRNSATLKAICERAGRYRRFSQAAQRKKTQHGRDEVVGIELGGDVDRLVGSELCRLAIPELELDTLRRIVERQAMVYKMEGSEKQARGPIMVFVDESGSMSGENLYQAKAVALAMAWLAKSQKRWVCLVSFSGRDSSGDPMKIKLPRIVLDPVRWNGEGLMQWLENFMGGGTTCDWLHDSTMEHMFSETGAPRGKTDVLLITDGAVRIGSEIVTPWLSWKKTNEAKLISLVIGGGSAGSLKEVSDSTHILSGNLGLEQEGVREALSI